MASLPFPRLGYLGSSPYSCSSSNLGRSKTPKSSKSPPPRLGSPSRRTLGRERAQYCCLLMERSEDHRSWHGGPWSFLSPY